MFTAKTDTDNTNYAISTAVAATGDTHWETTTYPTASAETHAWLREQRGLVRAFLASGLGSYGATATGAPRRSHTKESRSV